MESNKNIYKNDVDFMELGKQDEEFSKFLKPNGQLDFSDPKTVQQLTKALLKRDFGLRINLPDDRLCPPVPNRLNYLLWIQDLLDSTSKSYSDLHDMRRNVLGIDVGTGASCIYPIIGCSQYPAWKFVGTGNYDRQALAFLAKIALDIDMKSLGYATENVALNKLAHRIRVHETSTDRPIFPLDDLGLESCDFTMCNPPFYSSTTELSESAASKQRPPNSACTGAPNEMVCDGGEVGFVSRMITESLKLKDRVQWYTSMLGKFSSVAVIVQGLREAGVGNWAVMEFVQGTRTRRWAVAWSWDDMRPKSTTARGIGSLPKHLMPFPSEYCFSDKGTAAAASKKLENAMEQLDMHWRWRDSISQGVGFAAKNVWSRAARRKTKGSVAEDEEVDDEDGMAFGIRIRIVESSDSGSEVNVRWIKGNDSVLFESFCGMIKRKLES